MPRPTFLLVVLLLLPLLSDAQSPAAKRAIRNLTAAFANVQLLPELRTAPIEPARLQTARNLLRDLDSLVPRARGDLDLLPEADRGIAEVAELSRKLAEFEAFRADLKQNVERSAAVKKSAAPATPPAP